MKGKNQKKEVDEEDKEDEDDSLFVDDMYDPLSDKKNDDEDDDYVAMEVLDSAARSYRPMSLLLLVLKYKHNSLLSTLSGLSNARCKGRQ
jgi:hypothetical protein